MSVGNPQKSNLYLGKYFSVGNWPRYDFNGRLGWEIITGSIIWNRFPMSAVHQSAETPSRRQQFRAKLLEKFSEVSELNNFVQIDYVIF